MNNIYTIGFTKKTAKEFFDILQKNKISLVADIRLNNTGQLAGFTKKDDLKYFLHLHNIKYEHWIEFAPIKEMRKIYHSTNDWNYYEETYKKLLKDRFAIEKLEKNIFNNESIVLLCSEPTHERCHRRIAAEQIRNRTSNIDKIIHL